MGIETRIETRFVDDYDEIKWLYSQSHLKVNSCYYSPRINMYVVRIEYI